MDFPTWLGWDNISLQSCHVRAFRKYFLIVFVFGGDAIPMASVGLHVLGTKCYAPLSVLFGCHCAACFAPCQ
eukprot:6318722-Amphidinium_carterae.1